MTVNYYISDYFRRKIAERDYVSLLFTGAVYSCVTHDLSRSPVQSGSLFRNMNGWALHWNYVIFAEAYINDQLSCKLHSVKQQQAGYSSYKLYFTYAANNSFKLPVKTNTA